MKTIKKFISDLFKENKDDDKFSSKKTVGMLAAVLVLVSYVIDGFKFYEINTELFNSLLIYSGTMLGASLVKAFSKDK
jgi:uncharacterized membrane protein